MRGYTPGQLGAAALIAAFLLAFLAVPVATVIYVAFTEPAGGFTLSHFAAFFGLALMRESFWNSLYVAATSVVFATLIAVPLALAGTCAGMWFAGYSINNLSLMALAISVGFVVDDAIVMIENMFRNLEHGLPPFAAA